MELSTFIFTVEIYIRFLGPFFILFGLIIGYMIKREFLEKYSISVFILAVIIIGGIVGTFINIPILKTEGSWVFINVGGVVLPLIISGFFMFKYRRHFVLILLLIIMLILTTFLFAKVDTDVGIIIDFPYYFIPSLFGAIFSYLTFKDREKYGIISISYCVSTIGVFIGSDLLLLPRMLDFGFGVGYLGGFGVFDLIYITGLYAVAFSIFIIYLKHIKKDQSGIVD
jgi:uncharacterized membrane protein